MLVVVVVVVELLPMTRKYRLNCAADVGGDLDGTTTTTTTALPPPPPPSSSSPLNKKNINGCRHQKGNGSGEFSDREH
ncbi:unnamed protein product [Angiostrongylus costaricensis]|uniref:Secreted protein n=1 Tax=Angiostrongylus costaricensis TaxID=334426 RepID=A0A0R3PS31_ANGCS|nr:unnamed protein product [Angiostrongylus costaricensis]